MYNIYKMLSMAEKVSRITGHVLKGNSFFVSKSIGGYFAKPPSELIELSSIAVGY